MSDDLYIGPSVLEPGASDTGRRIASRLLIPLTLLFFGVILLFYVFFTATTVDGPSMESALLDGDRLLVTKGYHEPVRGEIVVFRAIVEAGAGEEDLVKRVIGLPGDTVEVRQGVPLVNGAVYQVDSAVISTGDRIYTQPAVVPRGHVFVLGDNRPISLDSRDLGPIPLESITGRAAFLFAPVTRAQRLP